MTVHSHHHFWMVWSPQGRSPTYKHLTRDGADREAQRLARQNPGLEFFVLKAVGGFVTPQPEVLDIFMRQAREDEIPF